LNWLIGSDFGRSSQRNDQKQLNRYSMATVKAWAAFKTKGELQPFTYDMPPLAAEEVEIKVEHCDPCLNGDQNLCINGQATIMGNYGGWSERVRAHWVRTMPIPEELDSRDAGPLMCAGITVFAPLMELDIRLTSQIGVFGIGGLGHLALQFAAAWGAKVTAFSKSPAKFEEIKRLGATTVLSSKDVDSWGLLTGKFDLIIITVAVPLDRNKIIQLLAPNGKLHFVALLPEPIPVPVLLLLLSQRSLTTNLGGSRGVMDKMLRFAAQHKIVAMY
jgi:alcohol/geraniol dehydrogenase (NADP+)